MFCKNPGIVGDGASVRRDFFSNLHRYDSDDEVERDLSYSNAVRWSRYLSLIIFAMLFDRHYFINWFCLFDRHY